MTSTPNLVALLGPAATASLLSLPKVSTLYLLRASPGEIMHLGKAADGEANDASDSGGSSSKNSGWLFRQPAIAAMEPHVRVKGAKLLATAIKSAAAADEPSLGRRAALDGSVGASLRADLDRRVVLLVPTVEFVPEEDKVLAVPVDIFDDAGDNVNAKHRGGAKLVRQKQIDKLEKILRQRLARCHSDEQRSQVMASRDVQALQREIEMWKRGGGGGGGGGGAAGAATAGGGAGAGGGGAGAGGGAAAAASGLPARRDRESDEYADLDDL